MVRWLPVSLIQRSLIALFVLCLGCSAQAPPSTDLNRTIERQVRSLFQLPVKVEVIVGARQPSEFPNYDILLVQLASGDRKQDEKFLISKDGKTLVQFNKMDLTKDPYLEVMRKINLENRPWRGKKDAKVVIVSYDDFQCPFCGRMHQTLFGPIYQKYADKVKIVYKDFPLVSIHPWATHAAVNSGCLAAQSYEAFWSYADYAHANGTQINQAAQQNDELDRISREQGQKFGLDMNKLNTCLKTQDAGAVNVSEQEGESLGITGTPVLFINGYKVDGALPAEEISLAIDRALRDTGEAPAAQAK